MKKQEIFEKFEQGEISFEKMREICGGIDNLDNAKISPVPMI